MVVFIISWTIAITHANTHAIRMADSDLILVCSGTNCNDILTAIACPRIPTDAILLSFLLIRIYFSYLLIAADAIAMLRG